STTTPVLTEYEDAVGVTHSSQRLAQVVPVLVKIGTTAINLVRPIVATCTKNVQNAGACVQILEAGTKALNWLGSVIGPKKKAATPTVGGEVNACIRPATAQELREWNGQHGAGSSHLADTA